MTVQKSAAGRKACRFLVFPSLLVKVEDHDVKDGYITTMYLQNRLK